MKVLKLYKLNELPDGTIRLQSQLYVGKNTADFIIDTDGILKIYNNGNKGFDFYEYTKPYIIVDNIKEMERQEL